MTQLFSLFSPLTRYEVLKLRDQWDRWLSSPMLVVLQESKGELEPRVSQSVFKQPVGSFTLCHVKQQFKYLQLKKIAELAYTSVHKNNSITIFIEILTFQFWTNLSLNVLVSCSFSKRFYSDVSYKLKCLVLVTRGSRTLNLNDQQIELDGLIQIHCHSRTQNILYWGSFACSLFC